jgi:N-acetylneuraminate lyase
MQVARLQGLIAAPYTAFDTEYRLHLDIIPLQAQSLVANGVIGAFVCGTTGEGVSLSLAERMQVAERWCAAAGPQLRVIVHVGHACLGDAQALAAHAQSIGAQAIATVGPSYFKPAALADLVDWCAEVAASAPGLPFYYYHIPVFTGLRFSMHAFLEQAAPRIATLAGIKFTDEDLMDYMRCLGRAGGAYDILFGRDEILLPALAAGARGAVGSTYGLIAPIYHRLIGQFERGELSAARRTQAQIQAFVALLGEYGGLVAGKAIMRMIGIDCGPPRLPLRPLSWARYEELRERLAQLELPFNGALEAA